ncbi:MAG: hypothetical protein PHS53_01180 [Candidatus Pacebacteria bacterium]|nr:hypothetical protein [Candidatus Paceibacterota bacterium]MDD5356745.1 hypothetical protein [Candidatus Paceibacterota bacterium]
MEREKREEAGRNDPWNNFWLINLAWLCVFALVMALNVRYTSRVPTPPEVRENLAIIGKNFVIVAYFYLATLPALLFGTIWRDKFVRYHVLSICWLIGMWMLYDAYVNEFIKDYFNPYQ